jgi:hypothetical protein
VIVSEKKKQILGSSSIQQNLFGASLSFSLPARHVCEASPHSPQRHGPYLQNAIPMTGALRGAASGIQSLPSPK